MFDHPSTPLRMRLKAAALASALLACAAAAAGAVAPPASAASIPRVHAAHGHNAVIRDSSGRQILLHGVNATALTDYRLVDPTQPVAPPVDDAELAQMRSLGVNVVRLAISWSRLEPRRGQISQSYIAKIRSAVDLAGDHGIYTVLDMHQDSYSKHVATPPGTTCPDGSMRSHGGDGAPRWATIMDGKTTCHRPTDPTGMRTPAVKRAWNNFWRDRRGIRTEFLRTWATLGRAFAHDPAIAGYDLLSEPGHRKQGGMPSLLAGLYGDAIERIRRAESHAGGFPHMIFFEPTLGWALSPLRRHSPQPGFTADRDIVFAPHIYGGAFARAGEAGSLPYRKWIRRQFAKVARRARAYGAPLWIGEWGRPKPINETEPRLDYHASRQDAGLVGGAWWLWKRGCGTAGPGSVIGNLFLVHCPDGAEVPSPNGARLRVISRPYPELAPGRLTRLKADPEAAHLSLAGAVKPGARNHWLEAWLPERGDVPPQFRGRNIDRGHLTRVAGGWELRVHARGDYRLNASY